MARSDRAEAFLSSTHRATPELPPSLFGDPFIAYDALPPAQRRTVRRAMRRAGTWPELRGRGRPSIYIARRTGAVWIVRFGVNGLIIKTFGNPDPSEQRAFTLACDSCPRPSRGPRAPASSITRVQKPNGA